METEDSVDARIIALREAGVSPVWIKTRLGLSGLTSNGPAFAGSRSPDPHDGNWLIDLLQVPLLNQFHYDAARGGVRLFPVTIH